MSDSTETPTAPVEDSRETEVPEQTANTEVEEHDTSDGLPKTQEDLDKVIGKRLARERERFADYDDLVKAKSESESKLSDLEAKNGELQSQLDEIASEKEAEALRNKVADEFEVPANALRGATEDELKDHAKTLKDALGMTKRNPIPRQGDKPSDPVVSEDLKAVRKLFGSK